MVGIDPADQKKIINTFRRIAWVVKKKAGKQGSHLQIVSRRLAQHFPGDQIFRLLDVVGDFLGRRTDALTLRVDTHGTVAGSLTELNRASKAWLIAFFGPAQGTNFGKRILADLEATAADFVLESHHAVPREARKFYSRELAVFPPDERETAMIAIAIPAGLHRGARYYPLEGKSPRLKQIRDSLPDRQYNLTDRMRSRFTEDYMSRTPFPTYLKELSEWYKSELPELYKHTDLPGGGRGGIREALILIAQKTNVDVNVIAP